MNESIAGTKPSPGADRTPSPYWNPYLAGVLLGLTLLASAADARGWASGGLARIGAEVESWIAPGIRRQRLFLGPGARIHCRTTRLHAAGRVSGGLVSAIFARRIEPQVERGKAATAGEGWALAAGGILPVMRPAWPAVHFRTALSGGAMLLTGSLIFMGCIRRRVCRRVFRQETVA